MDYKTLANHVKYIDHATAMVDRWGIDDAMELLLRCKVLLPSCPHDEHLPSLLSIAHAVIFSEATDILMHRERHLMVCESQLSKDVDALIELFGAIV